MVLVADGNSTTATLTRTLARFALGHGASYVSALSGPQAVWTAEQRHPDLVITEFKLPGSDGVETLKKIRERMGTKVPALVTVERIEREYVERRLPDRAAILVRPFDRSSLEAALRSLFAGLATAT